MSTVQSFDDSKLTSILNSSDDFSEQGRKKTPKTTKKISFSSLSTPKRAPFIEKRKSMARRRSEFRPFANKSEVWIKKSEFRGTPTKANFSLVKQDLPNLKEREIKIKAICWSINRYMTMCPIPVGSVMIGEQLARVEESRHPDFHQHAVVLASVGWSTQTVVNPDNVFVRLVPQPPPSVPLSLFLGTAGLPGMMLYFAFMSVCQPSAGDVVLINGNLFAIELVGTFALKTKCKVIVVVSTDRLKTYVMNKFHFHLVIEYKRLADPAVVFDRMFAPDGVDIYFDTVGAGFTPYVTRLLRPDTRTVVIGERKNYSTTLDRAIETDFEADPYQFTSFTSLRPTRHHLFDFRDFFMHAEQEILDIITKKDLDDCTRRSFSSDYVIRPKVNCAATEFKDLPLALGWLKNADICSNLVVPRETSIKGRWFTDHDSLDLFTVNVV